MRILVWIYRLRFNGATNISRFIKVIIEALKADEAEITLYSRHFFKKEIWKTRSQ